MAHSGARRLILALGCAFLLSLPVVGCSISSRVVPTKSATAVAPTQPPSTGEQLTITPAATTASPNVPTNDPKTPMATPSPTPSPAPTSTPTRSPPLTPHYAMSVTLDYDAHLIAAVETITLQNGTESPWTEVVLHASPAYWPGLLTLDHVQITLDGVTHSPPPQWRLTMLHVPLPRPLAPGEGMALEIGFTLSLPDLDPVGWGPAGNAGWGEGLAQVGDWYPALVPYDLERGWQTWQYHPVGDPVRNGLADYDVAIRTSDEVRLAAAGFVGQEDGVRRYRLQGARAFAFLASPDYVRFDGEAAGTPLQVYVLERHEWMGEDVLNSAARSLELFQDLFGPYPYDELVIAENGFLTAIEYSALISMSGFAFADYSGSPDNLLIAITAHEVAHQWWYGAVGNDQVEEPWLDESLAMMSELLFYEQFYPDFVDWWWYYRVERWEPTGTVDTKVTDYEHSREFVHDMYGQAAYFVRDLRSLMGRDTFLSFLRAYYDRHRDGWATGEDFFRVALAFAEKEDLRRLAEIYFAAPPEALSGE